MPDLLFSEVQQHVNQLVTAALAAAAPAGAVDRYLRREGAQLLIGPYNFQPGRGRVYLVGVGKAALPMGRAAINTLGDALAEGILITKRPSSAPDDQPRFYSTTIAGQKSIRIFEASHPVPDEGSLHATAAVAEMLAHTTPHDLVLCLISGGTSSLLSQPLLPLPEWQELITALLASGCTISELNAVRRALDRVKGGGLAVLAAPAACASLILSDVVGNPLADIGSGPTVAAPSGPAEARAVLDHYNLVSALTPETWQRVNSALGMATPLNLGSSQVVNLIIGDVQQAAQAAVAAARSLGFDAHLLTAHLEGEAREVGRVVAALAKDARPGTCLVLGGETTVTVRGPGRGGRNQELALAAAIALGGWEKVAVASFATDGEDGPTNAAGALITGQTAARAQALALDPQAFLKDNDSHNFFTILSAGGRSNLLQTGATGTNVNDLILICKYP